MRISFILSLCIVFFTVADMAGFNLLGQNNPSTPQSNSFPATGLNTSATFGSTPNQQNISFGSSITSGTSLFGSPNVSASQSNLSFGGSTMGAPTADANKPTFGFNLGGSATPAASTGPTLSLGGAGAAQLSFGAPTTNQPTFGGIQQPTYGAVASSQSTFGAAPSAAALPTFGATPSAAAQTTFGVAPSSAAQPTFGAAPSSASQSIFGAASSAIVQPTFGATASLQQSSFSAAATSQPLSFATATAQQPSFGAAATSQPLSFVAATTTQPPTFCATAAVQPLSFAATTAAPTLSFGAASATGTASMPFGVASAAPPASFGTVSTPSTISFGAANTAFTAAPQVAATAPTLSFNTLSTTQPSSTFGGASTSQPSLSFGATSTAQAPSFGGGGTTPSLFGAATTTQSSTVNAVSTPSISFGTTSTPQPSFGVASSGLSTSVGETTKPADATTASLPTLTGLSAAVAPAAAIPPLFLGTSTSTAASTATTTPSSFGLTSTTVTSVSGGSSVAFSWQKTTAETTTAQTSTVAGLGGVDHSTVATAKSSVNTITSVKEQPLPNEIQQTVVAFKEYVKTQKNLSSEVARSSAEPLTKLTQKIGSLNNLILTLRSVLSQQKFTAEKIKIETIKSLNDYELAQKIKDSPVTSEERMFSIRKYFAEKISAFEESTKVLQEKIEYVYQHVITLPQENSLSAEALKLIVKKLHDSFVVIGARAYKLHNDMQLLKVQYLTLRNHYVKDNSSILFSLNQEAQLPPETVVQTASKNADAMLEGPNPFSRSANGSSFNSLLLTSQNRNFAVGASSSAREWGSVPAGAAGAAASNLFGAGADIAGNCSFFGPTYTLTNSNSTNQPFNLQQPPLGNKRGKRQVF